MLTSLKNRIRSWLGIAQPAVPTVGTARPAVKNRPAAGKSSKNKRTEEPATRPPRRSVRSGEKKPRQLPALGQKTRILPVKPAALLEVPEVEGKTRFLDLPIHQDILFGLQEMGFQYCTPIQAQSLPVLLAGRDLAGKAQTGTGKTAAFLIAAFTRLLNQPLPERAAGYCRVLVMAPTRELAIQIHKDAEKIAAFANLNNVVVFGGMDHEKQRRSLDQPVDVLIGTPGRIIDFARGRSLNLSKTEILIIDEADRMLDMGFIPDVRRIIAQLPGREKRQTMFFSATLDDSILRLAQSWLREQTFIESEPEEVVGKTIEQIFYTAAIREKLPLLLYFIRTQHFDRMLVFGNRKDSNLSLQHQLSRYGVKAALLSGDIPQEKRLRILEDFRSGKEKIVIATDVAARGIHVDDVSVVINYDLPEHPEDYVHRIGRTGRAGHLGKSISFVCEYGAYVLPEIEKFIDMQFHCVWPEDEMLVLPEGQENWDRPEPAAPRKRSSRSPRRSRARR
ncbi:DEAD/DEAH box helicase [Victivallis sp. Marseille-Q1083]|uniref:DEAD/DEAH box helicase n=1 Tax=Victivallis sp. Marseille-Q1083 TaxID=2717288 RepID=UPI00158B5C11|nr:DEAD/DEAH box helicase [Victivallis sp. Marseille-Q1083]